MLTYSEIKDLLATGIVEGHNPELLGPASLDVRLGRDFMVEIQAQAHDPVDLSRKRNVRWHKVTTGCIELAPGEFILASTREIFHLPDDIVARFSTTSSLARNGLEQMAATNMWPTHKGSLTLELKNMLRYHTLLLTAGMVIGQITFERVTPVPEEHSYRATGRYNDIDTVSAAIAPVTKA